MLSNTRLPGPFSRLPIAWVIALIVFVLAGLSALTKSGGQQALLLAALGVILVLRGAMVFYQRRPIAGPPPIEPSSESPAPPRLVGARSPSAPDSIATVPEVPQTVIEARDLAKRYGQIVAVDGVSFSVQRGEIFALLGPNGAGKSTTLEMLEGLRDIDSGTAVVLGTDIKSNAVAVKRRIGVQLQATALPSFTTVREFDRPVPRVL